MLNALIKEIKQLNGNTVKITHYLFMPSTIGRASRLAENEIPIIEIELNGLVPIKTINKWIKLITKNQAPNSLSHIDIANMYLKTHADDTLYARSNYHRYKAGVWTILPEMFFQAEVGQLLEDLEKKSGGKFTNSQQKSIAAFITQKVVKNDIALDANPHLINLKNGTFCTQTQQLLPHNPKDLITTQLPFDYNEHAAAPNWVNYLQTTFVFMNLLKEFEPDIEMIAMIQEAIGYSLTASMKHHVSFWCVGDGANGKGVLFHILQALGGSAATAFNLDMLNQTYNTYHIAELAGKRIVYCTEVSKNFDFTGDAMFKAIVGGDKIQVRPIREKPFTMESISKIWISFNNFPNIKDNSHGFWRRVRTVPFLRQFDDEERDVNLREKLEGELAGIFNWAMQGLMRLEAQGWTRSEQVEALTRKYQKENNSIEMFIEDDCIIDAAGTCLVSSLYTNYSSWCKNYNHIPYALRNFKKELERLGYVSRRMARGVEIVGIKIDVFKPQNVS